MLFYNHIFTSIVLLNWSLVRFAVTTCPGGIKVCETGLWMQWGNCSKVCGGGIMKRSKSLCCPTKAVNTGPDKYEACVRNCNITNTHLHEEHHCNQDCFHGIFNNTRGKCHCFGNYTGDCCQHFIGIEDTAGSTGTIIGVCIGVIVAVVAGLFVVLFLYKRWKKQREKVMDSDVNIKEVTK